MPASVLLGYQYAVVSSPARMRPRSEWGPYDDAAPIDHLDLAGEVRRWSGVRTAGQVVPHDERVPS